MSGNATDPIPTNPSPDDPPGLPFLVAGVGASAGGLEAYSELLDEMRGAENRGSQHQRQLDCCRGT